MRTEHAIQFDNKITPKQLEYLIKKSNRLGLAGRTITKVFSVEESGQEHVYFDLNPNPVRKYDSTRI